MSMILQSIQKLSLKQLSYHTSSNAPRSQFSQAESRAICVRQALGMDGLLSLTGDPLHMSFQYIANHNPLHPIP